MTRLLTGLLLRFLNRLAPAPTNPADRLAQVEEDDEVWGPVGEYPDLPGSACPPRR